MKSILFEIGDTFAKGHGYNAAYIVKTNVNLDTLRTIHVIEQEYLASLFSTYTETLNDRCFDIEQCIQRYSQYTSIDSLVDSLQELALNHQFLTKEGEDLPAMHIDWFAIKKNFPTEYSKVYVKPNDHKFVLDIWLWALKQQKPDLQIEFISPLLSAKQQIFLKKNETVARNGVLAFTSYNEWGISYQPIGYSIWTPDATADLNLLEHLPPEILPLSIMAEYLVKEY